MKVSPRRCGLTGSARVVLTRHGRPVAALLPFGALDALDLLGRMLPAVPDVAPALEVPAADRLVAGPAPVASPYLLRGATPAPSEGPHGRQA